MKRPIDRLISSSRSEYFRSPARIDGSRDERCGHSRVPSPERRAPVGYALLILMMMVTLLLISLTATLPSIYMEAQREREEELIFRGVEYQKAIFLFRQKFQRYPRSVEELLKKTNGVRFLRHEYKDPMTKSGKWRFIHATPQGTLIDSKTMNVTAQGGAGGLLPSTFPGPGAQGATPQGNGPQGAAPEGAGQQGAASEETGAPPPTPEQAEKACLQAAEQSSSAGSGFIAGVASCSYKEAIGSFPNGKTHYDEWECLGAAPCMVPQVQMPGMPTGGGQGPGGPGSVSPGTGAPPTGQQASPPPQLPDNPPETVPPPDQSQPEPEPEPEPSPEPN